MIRTISFALLLALALTLPATLAVKAAEQADPQGWQYFRTGEARDLTPATRGLWVLQGGGDDVDENYRRMGEFGGHGDFVVLRASGTDDYNEYIFPLCACDSVETLVFSNRAAASDPQVLKIIEGAEALFIAGGDQSNYVRFWQGTPVEQTINRLAARGIPIGGTSAGMAVMGEFVYAAMTEASLTSSEALADPFSPNLTLARKFLHLPGLEGILTDQHLQERDRIGRTLALMARLAEEGWTDAPRAIAADRETAVHVDPATLQAEVFATAKHPTPYVYFLAGGRAERCAPGQTLTYDPVTVYRLGPGGSFDLRNWTGTGGVAYTLSVTDGVLQSSRGEIY